MVVGEGKKGKSVLCQTVEFRRVSGLKEDTSGNPS